MTADARVRVDTDRPEIGEALETLAGVVRETGGSLADGLYVRAREGELTLASDGPRERAARLLFVPYAAMPDSTRFPVTLRDQRFVAAAPADDAPAPGTPTARAHAAMLEIYNQMGKPQQWARQSPWLTLWHDPPVLDHLLGPAAANDPAGTGPLALYRAGRWDELLVSSFIKSRVFNLKAGKAPDGQGAQVLMPFIDFLNHHVQARGFQHVVADNGVGGLYTFQDRPVAGSDECFVRYNLMDTHTAFIGYGFLDDSAPYSVSQATTLTLSDGLQIQVRRQAAKGFAKKLPQKMRSLQIYMPQVVSNHPDKMAVSRLLIPGANAPRALRRVLATLIARKRQSWSEARVDAAVREAEAQLLAVNHRYFDALAALAADARARSEADDPPGRKATLRAVDALVVRNKRHLHAYQDRLEG